MCGMTFITVSPSSSSTSRSTPCVLGCCGPIFSVSVSVAAMSGHIFHVVIQEDRPVADQRIVLAQRVAYPVVRSEDTAQVGMVGERDPEEVIDLALTPVGVSKQPREGRDALALPDAHAHKQARVARQRVEVVEHLEPLRPVRVI